MSPIEADRPLIRVGLVGTGGIAKLHSAAYSLAGVYFPAPSPAPVKLVICDIDDDSARAGAASLGWQEWEGDYRALVERADVDLVDITTPNHLHADVAIAAAENGKMIVCEKPLSTDLDGARRMYDAAAKAGVPTAVNFQKRRHPAVMHAKHLLDSGAIGDVLFYHGTYRQPFGLLPPPPGSWRHARGQIGSLLAEVGSHVIDMARFLVGEFDAVSGMTDTQAAGRPEEIDSVIVWSAKLSNGALGSFEVCGKASGEGDGIGFEVYGTKGAIKWSNRHSQVLEVTSEETPEAERGFTAVRMGHAHPYGAVFGLLSQDGLVDAKAFETHDILAAFATGRPYSPDFGDGLRAAEVVDAVLRSAASGSWISIVSEP